MRFLEEYKKQILILVAIALVAASFITAGGKAQATAAESGVGAIITPVAAFFTNIRESVSGFFQEKSDASELEAENAALKAENERLSLENERLSLFEEENKRLSSLLETKQKYADFDMEGIPVIGWDPGNWRQMFMLGKGAKDGITANMPLITAKGLVGHITEAGHGYAKAQSILDSGSSVSAMSLRTGDIGVVRGDYALLSRGLCIMEYIPASAQIAAGDRIVTSYMSDIYPAGITIGYVAEISMDSNGLTQSAVIEPAADFEHLDTLLVITSADKTEVAEP